jgi:hypothetical protein
MSPWTVRWIFDSNLDLRKPKSWLMTPTRFLSAWELSKTQVAIMASNDILGYVEPHSFNDYWSELTMNIATASVSPSILGS